MTAHTARGGPAEVDRPDDEDEDRRDRHFVRSVPRAEPVDAGESAGCVGIAAFVRVDRANLPHKDLARSGDHRPVNGQNITKSHHMG